MLRLILPDIYFMKRFLKSPGAILVVFLLCCGSCSKAADTTRTILFVGNSLTYTNDLPSIVVELALAKGINVRTEMLAFPNYAFEDHWNDGRMETLIDDKKYDFVVIQQGPSSQEEGRVMLLEYGRRISVVCKRNNTQLVFFTVWPAYANFINFDNVIKNYGNAAASTQALLCPVGEAWKKYIVETGDLSYYGPDQFHPSEKGSRAAALIIVDTLFR
jgi:lysophospholipase L1-like esterase